MPISLPARPHLSHLRKQAKVLLRQQRSGERRVCATIRAYLPRSNQLDDQSILSSALRLRDAQNAVARQYGFSGWHDLRARVASIRGEQSATHSILSSPHATPGRGDQ